MRVTVLWRMHLLHCFIVTCRSRQCRLCLHIHDETAELTSCPPLHNLAESIWESMQSLALKQDCSGMHFRACLPQLPCVIVGHLAAVLLFLEVGACVLAHCIRLRQLECAGEPELAVAAGVLQRPVLVYSAVSAPGPSCTACVAMLCNHRCYNVSGSAVAAMLLTRNSPCSLPYCCCRAARAMNERACMRLCR